jgi:hypothetical protein
MKRRRTAQEQKLADDQRLLRWWKAWHREQRAAVCTGPHGAVLVELFRTLDNLQHVRPPQLIGLVRSIDWAAIDINTKLTTLHEFNAAITRYRTKCGAEPIDDTIADEPPFRTIKAIIFATSPHEGAHRGEARHEYP